MPANSFARQLAYGCSYALVLLMIVGSASARVLAGSLVVTTTADEQNTTGACSLREAIINANNDVQSGSADCAACDVGSVEYGSYPPVLFLALVRR